jgi:histidine triad (HIT) family protein
MADTIFGKIVSGEIPSEFVYEDEHCVAINDIHPQAPVHVLVIPRKPIPRLSDAQDEDRELLGHLMLAVGKITDQLGVSDGFRLVVNNGEGGGQTVFHLHLHILAGRSMSESELSRGIKA